jgi:ribosomal protein S18 acetylase RimI-like enzyme
LISNKNITWEIRVYYMEKINIEKMQIDELFKASEVLGKAFATQPASLAIYRGKTDKTRPNQVIFGAMLKYLPGQAFVAKQKDRIVGVMRMVKWPQCQMSALQRIRMLPILVRSGGGLGSLRRGMEFRGTWAKSDPKKPHYHLDPLGVLPELQGNGVGSQMMEFYCNHIDSIKMDAYHETDKPENVKFYQKFGFTVIGEETILDFPNWYMWRLAKK